MIEIVKPEFSRKIIDYSVTLRDTRDGYTGTIREKFTPGDIGEPEWQIASLWTEGNNQCDCNKSLRLYPDDESKWLECGDDVIELVEIVVGGRCLPAEWLRDR